MKINLYETLTQFGRMLQQRLFPALEEENGPLSEKHRQVITTLSLIGMEAHLDGYQGGRGRPPHDRLALARAFVAKAVFNLPTTEMLIQLLGSDVALRGICGWEAAATGRQDAHCPLSHHLTVSLNYPALLCLKAAVPPRR